MYNEALTPRIQSPTAPTNRLDYLELLIHAAEARIFTLETQLVRANTRIAELSGEGTTKKYPVLAGGAGHDTDDGEHMSFAEWRERKANRPNEDDF